MPARTYAHALYDALQRGGELDAEKLVNNFLAVVKTKGHRSLLPAILREYEKLVLSRAALDRGVLEVAKESDVTAHKERIKVAAKTLGASVETLEVRENPALVGGFVLRKEAEQYDASYRRQLLALYRKLIST